MARPLTKIDWNAVDKFLQAGCEGNEIAAYLGIHPETFYDRCLIDNNIGFSDYKQEKRASGYALLRNAQFNKALEGDSGMLKWLGIHILGQKETKMNEIEEASKRGVIDAIREIQDPNGTRAPSFSGSSLENKQPLLDQGCTGQSCQVPDELGTERTL